MVIVLIVYNYYRDYDPSLGRYIQSDPIGVLQDYSDPQMQVAVQMGGVDLSMEAGVNHLYGYVDQNPLNKIDPSGLGPVLGGACAAATATYGWNQVASVKQQIEQIKQEQLALLNRVNNSIESCDANDNKRLNQLNELRNRLIGEISDLAHQQVTNNLMGPAETAFSAGLAMICLGLTGIPVLP